MKTLRIARYTLRDVFRSRWVLLYGAFFLVITDALFRFGGGGERVLVSLMNVVLIAVPLVALVLGAMFLYGSREFVELLLSQPVKRRSLFGGLFAGLALPMAAAFLVGTGLPFLYFGGVGEGEAGAIALLLGTGVLLTLVFCAVAFLVALLTEDRVKGLGIALVLWFFFAVVFDGLLLVGIHLLGDFPVDRWVVGAVFANPVNLGRVLLLLNFEISAMMGFTGAVFQRFFGSGMGQALTVTALLAWVLVPAGLGLRAFCRKNF
jgi:Cu-processing system permease protein